MWGDGRGHSHLSKDLLVIGIHAILLNFHHGGTEFRSERLCDLHGFADSSTFNNDVVDFLGPCQTCQLRQQIAAQSAADAAILELDELFFRLGDFVVSDQGCIDVEPGFCQSWCCL